MAFQIAVAEIIKIAATANRYANLLESGKVVEGLIHSYLAGAVRDGLIKCGIPLDQFDFREQAVIWATEVLEEGGNDLAKNGLVGPIDKFLSELSEHVSGLLEGTAIGNGLPPTRNQSRGADPVLLHRGEFERQLIDLEVAGAGMDFAFRRTYRSGAGYLGPLGMSWDHAYNLRLREENDVVLIRLTGELAEDRFVQHPRFGEGGFSYYAPPDGIHDVIVRDGADSFLMKRPQGMTFHFESTAQPGEHRVKRIDDRFDNFLDFKYSAEDRLERVFVNSLARFVSFTYDDFGKVTRIEDHTGRGVAYTYDDWGHLNCVVGPALPGEKPAGMEQYEYEYVGEVRKLVRVWDWKDRIIVDNEYEQDALSDFFGYVIRQTENRGETTFTYETIREELDPTLPTREIPTLRVWESRRNGHQVEHIFNGSGNELLTRERFADGCLIRESLTRFRYNADGQIVAKLSPDGTLTQFLLSRDHLADSIPWPDVDPVLGDVAMNDRMSFGNLLATVTRGQRVSLNAALFDPGFWEQSVPSVKMPDHPDDVVIKRRYGGENQLLISTSDPRHTSSADPLHVESSSPGDPNFNPADPQFLDHQRHLTRTQYGPAPRFELQRTVLPDRTRPSMLDGVNSITGIVDEVRQYDVNGRPLERLDARSYEWFYEYHPYSADPALRAKEGFLRRQLVPHLDLPLDRDTLNLLEIQRNGIWQQLERCFLSSGTAGDAIAISVEGVRIALYQSTDSHEIVSANVQVAVTIDSIPLPPWNQSTDAAYVVSDLARGIHIVELRDNLGVPVAIGLVRTHVSIEYEVDDLGRILQETDARGRVTEKVVDVLGRKIKVTRGSATNPSIVHFEYDPGGQLTLERTEWSDETGHDRPEVAVVTRYRYDQAGLLLSSSVAAEQTGAKRITRHRYDTEDNLRETINPRGSRTYFDFDALNRQTRVVCGACSPDRSVVTTAYDLADRVLEQRNPRGAVHFNGYQDAAGEWHSGIDTRGRVRARTDPLGNMVVTGYDALDNPTVIRQFQRRVDGQFEMLSRCVTEYDEHGDAIRVTDAIFEEAILTADPVHAPDDEFWVAMNSSEVQSATTETHLDANGNAVATRSPVGGLERQRFDGRNRSYEQVDAEGRRTFQVRDSNGNVTRSYTFEPVRDLTSADVLYDEVFLQSREYDELNREIARGDAYGNRWQMQFDTLGNRTQTIDPLGNVVRYEYNAFGEETRRTQERTQTGLGGGAPLPAFVTQREYDEAGNVVAIIDPLQRRTESKFDELDRLIESRFAVDPNEPAESRRYDPASNLTILTDRNGLVRKIQYDLLNRQIRVDIDASGVDPANVLSPLSATFASFKYDAAGNRSQHENDYCVCETHRDSRGLPVSEQIKIQNIVGAPGQLEVGQGFDLAGRRTKLVYPSGREIAYTHDFLGRVTSVQNVVSPTDYPGQAANATGVDLCRYSYVGRRLVRADFGNDLTLTLSYDGRGHVLERAVTGTIGTVWRLQELRDAAAYTRFENAMTRTGARSRKFALDSFYRLTHYNDEGVQWIDSVPLAPPHAPVEPPHATGQALLDAAIGPLALPSGVPVFEYDEAGNRLQSQEPGLAPFSSVPNSLNQYAQVDGLQWKYDANGNLRSDGVRSFQYDINNAIQEIADGATNTSLAIYRRDALGRVVAETTPEGTICRVCDNRLPLLEFAPTGRTEFTPGNVPDAALHAAHGGEDYWLVYDGLTTMRLVIDGSASVVAMPLYRPYGVAEDEELSSAQLRFGFAGMRFTPGLPFYHSDHRTYRPDVGCHIQRDPAGLIDDINPYSYARNSPAQYADPSGLQVQADIIFEEDLIVVEKWKMPFILAGITPPAESDPKLYVPPPPEVTAPDALPGSVYDEMDNWLSRSFREKSARWRAEDESRSRESGAGGAPQFPRHEILGSLPIIGLAVSVPSDTAAAPADLWAASASITGVRLLPSLPAPGQYAWRVVRGRLGAELGLPKGTPVHHWAIPQGGTGRLTASGFFGEQWGRFVPDWIKNRGWNLMPPPPHVREAVAGRMWHEAVHGKGEYALRSMADRLWYGSPTWAKGVAAGTPVAAGTGAYALEE